MSERDSGVEHRERDERDGAADVAHHAPGRTTLAEQLGGGGPGRAGGPGKATLAEQLGGGDDLSREQFIARITALAARGTSGAGARLPHYDTIQRLFGRFDVSDIRAHVGGPAAQASRALGANAYAHGNSVAFAAAPGLHTAAHEAAHVVQQRGGVQLEGGLDGGASDPYERHADAVADRVVAGESAEGLLAEHAGGGGGGHAAVQRDTKTTAAARTGDMWKDLYHANMTPVGKLGRISAEIGRHLFTEPALSAPPASDPLKYNSLVHVERRTTQGDVAERWVYVVALDSGIGGFCEERYVAIDPPEPTAQLRPVIEGDTLGNIATAVYGAQMTGGANERTYVEALYKANLNGSGVKLQEVNLSAFDSLTRREAEQKTLEIYLGVRVIKGQSIWIPSDAFVQQLIAKREVTSGSTEIMKGWRAASAVVGGIVDGAEALAGFVVGALEGAYAAVRDLVKGAAEMLHAAYEFVKSLISGTILTTIKEAAHKLYDFIGKLPDAAKALGAWVANKWKTSGPFGKGELVGEIVGYIAVNVAIALATGGSAAAAELVEAGGDLARAVVSVLKVVDTAANPMTYLKPVMKAVKVPGELISAANRERKAARALTNAEEHGGAVERAIETPKGEGRVTTKVTEKTRKVTQQPLQSSVKFEMDFFRDLTPREQQLAKQLLRKGSVEVKSLAKSELVNLSKWFGKEIGVVQTPYAKLRVILGHSDTLLKEQVRADEQWLVHTHPVLKSNKDHFNIDIKSNSKDVEAVVDWSGDVTYFKGAKDGSGSVLSPYDGAGDIMPNGDFRAAFFDKDYNIIGFAKINKRGNAVKIIE